MVSLGPQERQYYDRLFSVVDKDNSGVLPGQDALPFLVSSNLPQQALGEIWAIADPDNNGFLTRDGWYKAARLIGWLQKGNKTNVDESLLALGEYLSKAKLIRPAGPYPTFNGQPPPPPQAMSAQNTGSSLPLLTPADRTKFTRIFVGCGPQNGLVSGDKARDVFVKSKLDYEKLGQIWNLADTQQRGSLDLTDFIIGMYLIQSCMANPSLALPATLPPGTYEQASGGRPAPAAPMSPQRTGSSLRPQTTGPSSPVRAATPRATGPAWDVTAEAKATSDRFFAQLDTQNRGVIEGDIAVPFMIQSQLDEGTLATIWDLADIRHEGRLDRDQFAVAMYLINAKLAGRDVPSTLPTSLVPPSLRGLHASNAADPSSGPSSATKDLFDLFDDTPAKPAPAPITAFSPQVATRQFSSPVPAVRSPPAPSQFAPPSDLLGDDSAPSLSSDSAEYGNKKNQLDNTTRALNDLTTTRENLERTTSSQTEQVQDLENKLTAAKSKYESEMKTVADLRVRAGEQSALKKKLEGEVISAESDLSAMKSEKDEIEQALLRDKEEIRGLQRMMKEIDEEKATLKTLLEKVRKEARQQKGMVTIAKKQLSTSEASRDSVQKEIDTASVREEEPATVPLPATPNALSPVATGVSQRSNNPFDRLARQSSPAQSSTGATGLIVGAGVAAAGAVVAGAETLLHAAQSVISPTDKEEQDDPFGTGQSKEPEQADSSEAISHDLGEVPTHHQGELDPFGMSSLDEIHSPVKAKGAEDATHISPSNAPVPLTEDLHLAPASEGQPVVDPAAGHLDNEPVTGEQSLSTRASPPASPEAAASGDALADPIEELVSSDEDEGPEDLERPARLDRENRETSGSTPALAPPLETVTPATRRSAPPPPAKSLSTLSAPSSAAPIAAAPPVAVVSPGKTGFEDEEDDFDFSDLPPARVDDAAQAPQPLSSFDDEFAGFDDEFDTRSSQVNSGSASGDASLSKSYEMVSPQAIATSTSDGFDEWGLAPATATTATAPPVASFDDAFGASEPLESHKPGPAVNTASTSLVAPPANNAASFDDAFGDDFDAAFASPPSAVPQTQANQAMSFDDAFGDVNPQPQPPASSSVLAPPPLPVRQDSTAQTDDIEDVKKLCSMGFSRSLVIAALDANGYDFQKSLNVLLSQ